MFLSLTDDQKIIFELIENSGELGIDKIVIKSSLSASKVASALLFLEFEGLVKCLPGKLYSIY